MNLSRNLFNGVAVLTVATVSLVGLSAIAFECAGKKAQMSEAALVEPTGNGGKTTTIAPASGRSTSATESGMDSSTSKLDGSVTNKKAWKLAAIALLATGGSLAVLAYKAWVARSAQSMVSVNSPSVDHPELEHPELQLTDLPKEALTNIPELDSEFIVSSGVGSSRSTVSTR
ncbi:MAG: hypothetical protein NW220_24520 [Leptolyngbyaceae cyanobacterium bins.349]|nr:hypothetical protein [Leptolyngbyaceae cyanobacterium bins.349]